MFLSCERQKNPYDLFQHYFPGIYLTVTMAMTSLSIVLTVFVLQLHHVGPNTKPVPRWIRAVVISVISRIICMRSSNTNYYQYDKKEREHLTRTGSLRRSGSFRSSVRERQRTQGQMTGGTTMMSSRRRQDEICLTSFIDNLDMLKDTNCNGRLGQSDSGVFSVYGYGWPHKPECHLWQDI